jgi:hypothetical protein
LIALDIRGVASRDRIHEPKAGGKRGSKRKSRRQKPEEKKIRRMWFPPYPF